MSDQGRFLERNPHLRENYLLVCEAFAVEPYSEDAPEYIAIISLEPPSDEAVAYFRRLHGIDPPEGRAA